MKCRSVLSNNKGFTLIELMVTLAIASFFAGATIMIVDSTANAYRSQEQVVEAQQDVRSALDLMVREIRMAGADPAKGSNSGIITADDELLQFTTDRDMSNAIETGEFENVTYSYDAATQSLIRSYPRASGGPRDDPLIDNVSALRFQYLDSEDEPTIVPSEIVTVLIEVTCQARQRKLGMVTRTLRTSVNIRNLML